MAILPRASLEYKVMRSLSPLFFFQTDFYQKDKTILVVRCDSNSARIAENKGVSGRLMQEPLPYSMTLESLLCRTSLFILKANCNCLLLMNRLKMGQEGLSWLCGLTAEPSMSKSPSLSTSMGKWQAAFRQLLPPHMKASLLTLDWAYRWDACKLKGCYSTSSACKGVANTYNAKIPSQKSQNLLFLCLGMIPCTCNSASSSFPEDL